MVADKRHIVARISEGTFPSTLEVLLLSYGATSRDDGYELRPLRLREAARYLAHTLEELGIDAEFDDATSSFMEQHVSEIEAREEASAITPLSRDEILRRIHASRRWGTTRELKPVQIANLGRLLQLRHGANFSVPGAGKTSTALAIYEALYGAKKVERLLVVAPKNAFLAWEDEIEKCYKPNARPKVARLTSGSVAQRELETEPEVCIVSYQLLPNVVELVDNWTRSAPTHVVLDESHRVKSGITGILSSTALSLAESATRRDILSGTPMPQSAEDLRSQFQFLWPGQAILPLSSLRGDVSEEMLTDVQQAVTPLYTRTTKGDLDLPELKLEHIPVALGPLQRELYDLLRSEARRVAVGLGPRDRQYFRTLGRHVMRLLEAASNPALLATGALLDDDAKHGTEVGSRAFELLRECARREQPAKLKEVEKRVAAAAPHERVLIWTSFTQNIIQLERMLDKWNPVSIYGDIVTGSEEDDRTRENRIRRFHNDESCRVMIANPAACGEGISLHRACHYAIYLDRTFNAAHFLQSVDRIHRLGLPPGTLTRVQVIEARSTIDSRVTTRMNTKIDAMSRVLNDPGLGALAYDPEDVEDEFPGGLQPEDVEEVLEHITERDSDPR